MNMKILIDVLILIFVIFFGSLNGECFDVNIKYSCGKLHCNQNLLSTKTWRTPSDCAGDCTLTQQCSTWTWTHGQCLLMSITGNYSKVPSIGDISGFKEMKCLESAVVGRQCKQNGNKKSIQCIAGTSIRLKTSAKNVDRSGQLNRDLGTTCVTEVDDENNVLSLTKNVQCESDTKNQTNFGGSVQSQLEKMSQELEQLRFGITKLQCPTWSRWENWNKCQFTENSICQQTRTRKCQEFLLKTETETKKCATKTCKQNSKLLSPRAGSPPIPSTSSSSSTSSTSSSSSSSCAGRCGQSPNPKASCQCHAWCSGSGSCCNDYQQICKSPISFPKPTMKPMADPFANDGPVTDDDLTKLFEKLLLEDQNNMARFLTVDAGCKTRVGHTRDCSPGPLLKVSTDIWSVPVYKMLRVLYDNYDADVTVKEDRTTTEKQEEHQFLNLILSSKTMITTLNFLHAKKLIKGSREQFKNLLIELWFDNYSRGNRILGSSGFEHVFMGEKKNGAVQGFHNWAYFYYMEQKRKVNNLGHWSNVKISDKGSNLHFTFMWGNEQKPHGSFLIGTSPEFEMAVYTTCILARPDEKCKFSLFGHKMTLTTHVWDYRGKKRVASAYFN